MKKSNQNFIVCLVILFIGLPLINQISPENYYSQENSVQRLVNTNSFNPSDINVFFNATNSNLSQQVYCDKTNSNNNFSYYELRKSNESLTSFYSISTVSDTAKVLTEHLPYYFQYKVINEEALKSYLETRSSLLINELYFSSIIGVAKDFNINPILLFAITGQEQGFVPTTEYSCIEIANNPYNVFCSWQDYNTDIVDSSQIACRTIINLSKDKPDNIDTLVWINRKYSADQNWSEGVRTLYNDIDTFIYNYSKSKGPVSE